MKVKVQYYELAVVNLDQSYMMRFVEPHETEWWKVTVKYQDYLNDQYATHNVLAKSIQEQWRTLLLEPILARGIVDDTVEIPSLEDVTLIDVNIGSGAGI